LWEGGGRREEDADDKGLGGVWGDPNGIKLNFVEEGDDGDVAE
jgi:hypothetical protein